MEGGGARVPDDSRNEAEVGLNRLPRFLHILNPNAAHRSQVRKFFEKNPRAPSVWVERHQHPTHLETVLEWALLRGARELAIWGGDGTFSRAVQWLWTQKELRQMKLVLVPVGTGNDFARTMKLHPWRKSLGRIFSENAVLSHTDLGVVEAGKKKRIFVNNAGFGRSQAMVERPGSHPVRDILSLEEKQIQVEWEEGGVRSTETIRALMAIFFNAPYFNRGLHFDPSMSPTDGQLNAVFVPSVSRLSLLWRFAKGRLGKPLAASDDIRIAASRIELSSKTDLFPQVDGERAFDKPVRQVAFEILPKQLPVYS